MIEEGFQLDGERLYLAGKARGIHRPRQMQRSVLSIKTTRPRKGRVARYDDSIGSDGYFLYAFQGNDPSSRDNTCLREAFEDQSPLIYFYALVPGVYQILYPCYLMGWDPQGLRCTVAVGSPHELRLSDEMLLLWLRCYDESSRLWALFVCPAPPAVQQSLDIGKSLYDSVRR